MNNDDIIIKLKKIRNELVDIHWQYDKSLAVIWEKMRKLEKELKE